MSCSSTRCHRRRSSALAVCLLALLAGSPDARAAEGDDEGRPETEPVFYETATVRARAVSGATASVTVLDRETIESLDVPTAAELLRFVPGVDVAPSGPRAGFATAQIRGGDPNYTYVLIDGVPLNDPSDQLGGTVNLNSLSTAHIERVEIVRGPLSSFLGSTGLAGVINIITRRGSDSATFSVGLTAGDDATRLGSAALAGGSDASDYYVGLFWEKQRDAIDNAEDEFDQVGVQGNGRVALGRESELRLSSRYAVWDSVDYPDASGGPLLGSGDTRDTDNAEWSLGVEARLGRAERRHVLRGTLYRHEFDRRSPFILNPADPAGSVPASIEDTTFTTWQLGWTAPRVRAGALHVDFGADLRVEDGKSDSFLPDVQGFPLDLSYRVDRAIGGVHADAVAERGRLRVEFGARVDVPEGFDAEVNPRAGLSYRLPGERTRLRASAGRAFKLPSFFALSAPIFGNPKLRPETAIGIDAGVEQRFVSAGLTVVLNVFWNRFEDLVDFDDGMLIHVNVPEVTSRGVELSFDWQPIDRVSVRGDATRQNFDADRASDSLTQRPDWYGALQFRWDVCERVRWVLDGQWRSAVFDFQIPLGTQRTEGYRLYGTAAQVRLAPGWRLHARVDNLADHRYQPFLGFPGPDRSFRVGLRYESGSRTE